MTTTATKITRRAAIISVIIAVGLTNCLGCMPGQRLLRAQIEVDGAAVLESDDFGVPDSWDKFAAWRKLSGASFKPVGAVSPSVEDPQRLVLKGKIRIVLLHATRPFAAAEIEDLRLNADPTDAERWQLMPEEVDRTKSLL